MKKTSVYLSESEAEGLRQLAAASGRSQAELLRQAVRDALDAELPQRVFHSLGKGRGDDHHVRWSSDELYAKAMGTKPGSIKSSRTQRAPAGHTRLQSS